MGCAEAEPRGDRPPQAARGAVVEAGHLWGHRLNAFAAAATDCWKA